MAGESQGEGANGFGKAVCVGGEAVSAEGMGRGELGPDRAEGAGEEKRDSGGWVGVCRGHLSLREAAPVPSLVRGRRGLLRDDVVRTGPSGCKEIPRCARNDRLLAGVSVWNAQKHERLRRAQAPSKKADTRREAPGGRGRAEMRDARAIKRAIAPRSAFSCAPGRPFPGGRPGPGRCRSLRPPPSGSCPRKSAG
jgi:hypothetical protein